MISFDKTQIKNPTEERKIFIKRLRVVVAFILILLSSVFVRVYYLQTWLYSDFIGQSRAYHIRLRTIIPERGTILDSKERVLAGNVLSYNLAVHPLLVEDINELMERISEVVVLTEEEKDNFLKNFRASSRLNDLIVLKETLTEKEIAGIAVNKYHLTGVVIEPRYQRLYPIKKTVSHVLGYMGKLSKEEYAQADRSEYKYYHQTGKTGLEKFYETDLRGYSGVEEAGVDAHGNVVKVYRRTSALRGKDLRLWLDLDVQEFATEAIGDRVGAILVADVASGGIICMLSKPSYDNNEFVIALSQEKYSVLLKDPSRPLVNRAATGRYPPGSTIKPFYAISALTNGDTSPTFKIYDKGYFRLPNSNQVFRNWKRTGHGEVALRRALRVSSDTYFYTLAMRQGRAKAYDSLHSFRFGRRGALDVYDEIPLPLPTPQWKLDTHNLPWFPGDTVNMGIGQGYLLNTPMQLLTGTLILANRGLDVRPRLVRSIDNVPAFKTEDEEQDIRIEATEEHWDLVFNGMADVMHSDEGTARYAALGMNYKMAGKTGTAQVVSLRTIDRAKEEGQEIKREWLDHALFLGFAPLENPKYAIVVVLENGGTGSNAAKLARAVMDHIMESRNELSQSE